MNADRLQNDLEKTVAEDRTPKANVTPWRKDLALVLVLAAVLLMGLGRVALLPPFVGQDEIAHYSRVEAIAFDAPKSRSRFVAADATACMDIGPIPHDWIVVEAFSSAFNKALQTGAPLDIPGEIRRQAHVDYEAFFSGPSSRRKDFSRRCRDGAAEPFFSASPQENWEFQHPPLYYMLLAPALRFFPGASVAGRLLILRTLGWLAAFAGFALGILATLKHHEIRQTPGARDIALLGAFMPFLLPAFFEEFGRVGNDSLCLLLVSSMWALTLLYLRRPEDKAVWAALGVISGYGWLTKATMIAISGGLFVFMAVQPPLGKYREFKMARRLGRQLAPAAVAALVAFVVGFTPYSPTEKSELNGSYEFDHWLHGQGFLRPGANVPWHLVFRSQVDFVTSFIFAYTDIPSSPAGQTVTGLAAVVVALVFTGWLLSLPRDPRREEWIPLYLLLPIATGISLWGAMAAISYRVTGATPGFYMHVVAPALALIAGGGLAAWTRNTAGRRAAGVLLVGMTAGSAALALLRVVTITGCSALSANGPATAVGAACSWDAIYGRLGILVWPAYGSLCVVLSLLLLTAGTFLALKRFKCFAYDSPAKA